MANLTLSLFLSIKDFANSNNINNEITLLPSKLRNKNWWWQSCKVETKEIVNVSIHGYHYKIREKLITVN